jgi:hypothetical protein
MSPNIGGGTGTPVVLVPCVAAPCETDILNGVQLGLTLDRYQELMRLAPAAFNGLNKPDEEGCYDCWAIWKQTDRDAMAIVIAQAEEMRERELGYHVYPKYDSEMQDYSSSGMYFLEKKYLIKIGTFASSDISLGNPISLSPLSDPVTFVIPTTVTDPDEICVYHPGTIVEINPSSVTISGGLVTICIPRSRLKLLTIDGNCEPYPDYYDDDNFESEVDVRRCYIDTADGADITCMNSCDCTTSTVTDWCQFIRDYKLSVVKVFPLLCESTCCHPKKITIPYLSGIQSSLYTEMMTASLANSLLKDIIPAMVDLCNCWKSDMTLADNAMWSPYGITNGAIKAWLADSRAKVGVGGKF